jgi:cytochrome c
MQDPPRRARRRRGRSLDPEDADPCQTLTPPKVARPGARREFPTANQGPTMKKLLIPALAAAAVLVTPLAQANADMANNLCGKCHEMDKKKKGPSYKSMAAKYKGKEAEAVKAITDPKGDHPEVKAKSEDIASVVKWMVAQ